MARDRKLEAASAAWDNWVGSQSVEDFMYYSESDDVETAVDEYIVEIPNMFPETTQEDIDNVSEYWTLAELLVYFIEQQ